MADESVVKLAPDSPVPVAMAERFNVPSFDSYDGPQRLVPDSPPLRRMLHPQNGVVPAEVLILSSQLPKAPAASSQHLEHSLSSESGSDLSTKSDTVGQQELETLAARADIRPAFQQPVRMAHSHNRPTQPNIRPQVPPGVRMAHRHNTPSSAPPTAVAAPNQQQRGAAKPKRCTVS